MQIPILPARWVAWRLFQASLCLVCFLTLQRIEGAEPQYQGKTASYWIKAYTMGMTEEDYARSGGKINWDGNEVGRAKETRENANKAFKEMGPAAVPYVVSWIKSADAIAYRFAMHRNETLDETKKPLPTWVTADDVEWRGLEALKAFGPKAKEAMPVIMEFIGSKSVFTAGMACEALGSLESEGEPALAILAFKLTDKDPAIRTLSASAIAGILPFCPNRAQHQTVLQALIRALKDNAKSVRWNAATAIGNFAADGKDAVPALIDSWKAGNEQAASALGQMGPHAKAAIPVLTEAATGTDPYLKRLATDALKRINREVPKSRPADIYDESADGAKQIADALVIAKKENKHVLLQFGANWCGWCHRLHKLFESDKSIAEKLKSDFVVVLIDVNKEHNKDINERYGNPTQFGLPVIVVLDANGKQLTTQDTGKLEAGDRHDPENVMTFLKAWSPKK